MPDRCDGENLRVLLESANIRFRIVHHKIRGSTVDQSAERGHAPSLAVKVLLLEGLDHSDEKVRLLCAIPGDKRLSYDAVRNVGGLRRIWTMPRREAERLMSCPSGSFPPICLEGGAQHVFDWSFKAISDAVVIGSGCLTESYWVDIKEIIGVAKPKFGRITL